MKILDVSLDTQTLGIFLAGLMFGCIIGVTVSYSNRLNFMQLVTERDGRLSETKLWSNIAKFVIVISFMYYVYTFKADEWLWLVFGSMLIGHRAVSNWNSQKFNFINSSKQEDTSSK